MKIYFAALEPTLTTDADGRYCEWAWAEKTEALYGEEWKGDVEAYLLNAADDEDEMEAVMSRQYIGVIHSLPENAIVLTDESGTPREIWWAE